MAWIIQNSIDKLMKNRENESPISKATDGIEDYTQKQISINVGEIREVFDLASRARNSLNFIRSLWEVSLIDEIEPFFKSLCVDNSDYQKIFEDVPASLDSADNYFARCDALLKATSFLREYNCLSEVKEVVAFLKNLDKGDFRPLSDESLRRKLSA